METSKRLMKNSERGKLLKFPTLAISKSLLLYIILEKGVVNNSLRPLFLLYKAVNTCILPLILKFRVVNGCILPPILKFRAVNTYILPPFLKWIEKIYFHPPFSALSLF